MLKAGDRVTLHDSPREYQIAACFGHSCGLLSPDWPAGATQPVALHQIAKVNGRPVAFEQSPAQPKRRRPKAA